MKFRDLEKGSSVDWQTEDKVSSLNEWYLSVRDIHLSELGVGDICRALRQDLFVSEVLPIAVTLLNDDVLIGERYDGELIAALSSLNSRYWKENREAGSEVGCAVVNAEELSKDPEFLKDLSTLISVLGEVNKL